MIRRSQVGLLLVASVVMLAFGCAEGPKKADPAVVAEVRQRVVLTEEPDSAVTTLEWREAEAAESSSPPADEPATQEPSLTLTVEPIEVDSTVLVGTVGGMPNPWAENEPNFPWREGEATFFLVDPATAAEFAEHEAEAGPAHDDCPFCAREAANQSNAIAAVRFLDSTGEPIKIDVRELFNLKAGDLVVVRGKAKLLGGDLLVLDADGLYVR